MKNCRKNALKSGNGITLIALVVTIIVLLILAGISITMITGNNSILQKTTETKTESEKGQERESVALAYYSALAKKVSNGDSTAVTASELNDELSNDNSVESVKGNNPIKVTFKSTRQYKVYSNGTVEYAGIKSGDDTDKTLVDMFKQAQEDKCDGTNCTNPANHLHIGDYVDYKNPTSGKYEYTNDGYTQTFEITNNKNQLNWQVLGLTDDGKSVKLIAATPVKEREDYIPYVKNPTMEVLEEVSKLYKNEYVKEARSISMDDIIQAFGSEFGETGYLLREPDETLMGPLTDEQYDYVSDLWNNGAYVLGDRDSGCKIWYNAPQMVTITPLVKLIFENTKLNADNYQKVCGRIYYVSNNEGKILIANSGSHNIPDATGYGVKEINGFSAYGAIRPVMVLNEDVTTEDIGKIENKTEETWNYTFSWYFE